MPQIFILTFELHKLTDKGTNTHWIEGCLETVSIAFGLDWFVVNAAQFIFYSLHNIQVKAKYDSFKT